MTGCPQAAPPPTVPPQRSTPALEAERNAENADRAGAKADADARAEHREMREVAPKTTPQQP